MRPKESGNSWWCHAGIIYHYNLSGWWFQPSEKYEFVNGQDDIPYIMENKSHVWNHQLVINTKATSPHKTWDAFLLLRGDWASVDFGRVLLSTTVGKGTAGDPKSHYKTFTPWHTNLGHLKVPQIRSESSILRSIQLCTGKILKIRSPKTAVKFMAQGPTKSGRS